MDRDKLLEMINAEPISFTIEEIENIMDEELEKAPEEMDGELVQICLNVLTEAHSEAEKVEVEPEKKKIYYRKPFRALIAAAVIILFIASALTVSAQVFNFNIPKEIAKLINGNAQIDMNLENADTTADGYALLETEFAKEIAEKIGITPITFPEEMIGENCEITEIENYTVDETVSLDALIDFEYMGNYGDLIIIQYQQDFEFVGVDQSIDVISGQMIKANGMDILIFEHKGGNSCTIRYKDNLTEYCIDLKCDIDTAIQFAESIK